jgi:Family of unknown function (DUF6152)
MHHALLSNRRQVLMLCAAASATPFSALAHHGWSSFDIDRPVYLEGKVSSVKWQNPHAELVLEVGNAVKLPADLAQRPVPAQAAAVDAKAVLGKAQLPTRKDSKWEIELAPLSRMEAWKVAEIKAGAPFAVVGYTFKDEKGDAVLRAEYIWVDGKTYALRSGPA